MSGSPNCVIERSSKQITLQAAQVSNWHAKVVVESLSADMKRVISESHCSELSSSSSNCWFFFSDRYSGAKGPFLTLIARFLERETLFFFYDILLRKEPSDFFFFNFFFEFDDFPPSLSVPYSLDAANFYRRAIKYVQTAKNIWKSYIWTADKDVNESMKVILAVLCTTWAVAKIRPEKKKKTTTAQVVHITARITFLHKICTCSYCSSWYEKGDELYSFVSRYIHFGCWSRRFDFNTASLHQAMRWSYLEQG